VLQRQLALQLEGVGISVGWRLESCASPVPLGGLLTVWVRCHLSSVQVEALLAGWIYISNV